MTGWSAAARTNWRPAPTGTPPPAHTCPSRPAWFPRRAPAERSPLWPTEAALSGLRSRSCRHDRLTALADPLQDLSYDSSELEVQHTVPVLLEDQQRERSSNQRSSE